MLISVIIPVYNREAELKRAIDSVLKQTIQDVEVLVVDDCSTIDLKPVIHDFNDARIKYFCLPAKGNANVCRNLGIKEAKGAYIAMLDSDDEWMPDHLEKKLKCIEENGADGVFGSIVIDDTEKQQIIYSREINNKESMVNYLLSGGWAPTPTHFYKTDCARATMWDETLLRNQDLDFSVRFAERYRFVPSKDVTCIVHWKKNEKRTEHLESQRKFLEKHGHKIRPDIYCRYYAEIYHRVKNRPDVEQGLQDYFKRESVRYPHAVSLTTYLAIVAAENSAIKRLLYRFIYTTRVLFNIK